MATDNSNSPIIIIEVNPSGVETTPKMTQPINKKKLPIGDYEAVYLKKVKELRDKK